MTDTRRQIKTFSHRKAPSIWLALLLWVTALPFAWSAEGQPTMPANPPTEAPVTSQPWQFGITGRFWAPTLHAHFFSSEGGLSGTRINATSDLGLPEKKSFLYPMLSAFYKDRHRLTVSYLPMRYAAGTTLTQAINIQGMQFAAGTSVRSELKLTDLTFTYDYVLRTHPSWSGYLSGQVHYVDVSGTLASSTTTSSERVKIPIPTVGGGVTVNPNVWWSAKGEMHLFTLPAGDIQAEMIDAQIGVSIYPLAMIGHEPRRLCTIFSTDLCLPFDPTMLEGVAASAGFKYFRFLAKESSNTSFDWLQKGIFFDLTYQF